MLVFRGQIPPGTELDLPTLRGSFEFPIKYGYASVGTVVDVGSSVANVTRGDTVFALHPHQTEYIAPADIVVSLPKGIDPECGVFLANVETAVNAVLDAAPRLGERVVVFGQGVVGLLITQLLRRTGLRELVAVDTFETRRSRALQLGASAAIDPAELQAGQDFDLA